MPLLDVDSVCRDFVVRGFFGRRTGFLRAVDSVTFNVEAGEVLGIVGETGSGKSTLAKVIAGIVKPTFGAVSLSGEIVSSKRMTPRRNGRAKLQYVYQDPGAALDPRWTIRRSLHEPLIIHTKLTKEERETKILAIVAALDLPSGLLDRYPNEISGGQQRRVGLARVVLLSPSVVIFDEPTAGLDPLVQASVLELLTDLRQRFKLTYLMISHDMNLISLTCDRVAVMHRGKIVEIAPSRELMLKPVHPYTKSLIMSSPRIGGVRLTDEPDLRSPMSRASGTSTCD
ncbi:ABC transporter ATP-binding protein [Rhizobium brockwellii]|uniref:ABC transporter ATP-binding protein n=1 Tax=Rhizobium brockwellii TaxID=3019932 RepID=UPI003F9EB478